MWLQRKIMTRVMDDTRFFDFDAIGGWRDLEDSVKAMPDDYTRLVPVLGENDPDDAFSSVPYEKGFNLVYSLEREVGTAPFEAFFVAYIEKFAFRTITSYEFKDYFLSHFPDAVVDWETWFHKPGMPVDTPNFDRTLSAASEKLADDWIAYDRANGGGDMPTTEVKDWSSNQIVCFLNALMSLAEAKPLKLGTLSGFDDLYEMAKSRNSEILFRYCMFAVASEDKSILPVVTRFITTQGRMKFVRPLYSALFRSKMGKKLAVETFLENKDIYHPICAKMVATDLSEKKKRSSSSKYTTLEQILLWSAAGLAVAAGIGLVVVRRRR